jgi:ribosomal-protein-alanine N-acetyltransferase
MSEPAAIPILQTPRLRLRPFADADAPALHDAFGHADTKRLRDALPSPDVAETAARIGQSRAADAQWHAAFAVILRGDDRLVGMANYHARRPWHQRLAVGWIVAPSWRQQGIMREAITALLDHCFDSMDTHRIEAPIEPANSRSVRLAERLGFRCEGLMRDWLFVGGEPRSLSLYALLRPGWTAPD